MVVLRSRAIVSAPASKPRADKRRRSSTIRFTVESAIAVGERFGDATALGTPRLPRRGNGHPLIHPRTSNPISWGDLVADRPSTTTAVITNRALDTHQRQSRLPQRPADGVRHDRDIGPGCP